MCGICGIFQFDGEPVQRDILRRMTDTIAHRGPDSDGYHLDEQTPGFALGFRRLSIIDLQTGDQPIYSEDRQVVTVFNGEIYNYRPLRDELQADGHLFKSRTDTEVLVHGYEQWRDSLPDKLRGMYAFAIWDSARGRLMLVRDRMGQKPLYYAWWGDTFLFASEIKALLQHPAARREVNTEVMPEYLALGYVLPPNTLFKNIYKLAPGHVLTVEADGRLEDRAYWNPTIAIDESTSRAAQARHIREKLESVVEMRLMSDVPLGTFLSGGVDSTTITALTGRMTGQAVKSFTVGFDFQKDSIGDRKFNVDLHHARDAAAALGCDHREIVLRHDDLLTELLPQLIYAMDEPVADTAIMQTVFVAALARVHGVPVLLSGDGADEIFGGYPFFQAANRIDQYKSLVPGFLRDYVFHPIIRQLPNTGRFASLHKLAEKAAYESPGEHFLSWESNHRFAGIYGVMRDQDIARSGTSALLQKLDTMMNALPVERMLDRIAYARLRLWLAEDNNMRVDKIAMAMSIEVRSPFEDHEMVNAGLSIPLRHKLPDGGKAVLKDAIADLIPAQNVQRAKWGFEPPMSDWLRTIFRPLVDTYLSKECLTATGFNAEVVQHMVDDHMNRRGYYLHQLWNLLVFQLWHAIYIDESLKLPAKWSAQELYERSQVQTH